MPETKTKWDQKVPSNSLRVIVPIRILETLKQSKESITVPHFHSYLQECSCTQMGGNGGKKYLKQDISASKSNKPGHCTQENILTTSLFSWMNRFFIQTYWMVEKCCKGNLSTFFLTVGQWCVKYFPKRST